MSFVSVVMTVYNGQRFLHEQIKSVLDQLLPGDELIVIDDASTDESLSLLRSIHSPLLRIYSNPCNLGVVRSFERGLLLAVHEFIFLSDQDDVWMPHKRGTFVAAFERDPMLLVVVSDAEVIDEQGRVTASSFMETRGLFSGGVLATLFRNRYLGCAMALRSCLLADALPMPRYVPMHDMWLGAIGSMTGKVRFLGFPLIKYRRHASNLSPSNRQSLMKMLRWRIAFLLAIVNRSLSLKLGSLRLLTKHKNLKK